MSPGNPFILGLKGQGHESQKRQKVPAWVSVLLRVLASFSCLCILLSSLVSSVVYGTFYF